MVWSLTSIRVFKWMLMVLAAVLVTLIVGLHTWSELGYSITSRQRFRSAKKNADQSTEEVNPAPAAPAAPDSLSLPWYMSGGARRPTYSAAPLPMFPEEAPGSDRIIEQLMYVLPKEESHPTKRVLLAHRFASDPLLRDHPALDPLCPVNECAFTFDWAAVDDVDAIVITDDVVNQLRRSRPEQIWISYNLEAPAFSEMATGGDRGVNWTATFRRDSDIVTPYERWALHDPAVAERQQHRDYAAGKTKKVAWFVSNCRSSNHRLRYGRDLGKYISVDIYGTCGPKTCIRDDPRCFAMLRTDYKFYLAFENANSKDYITEKLFHNALRTSTHDTWQFFDYQISPPRQCPAEDSIKWDRDVRELLSRPCRIDCQPYHCKKRNDILPIVMGAAPSSYAAQAPSHSYVHVDDFAGPKELAEYLHTLDRNDTLYNQYFRWKGTGEFINTFFFCRLCAMLHAAHRQKRVKHYEDVNKWWFEESSDSNSSTRDRRNFFFRQLLPLK